MSDRLIRFALSALTILLLLRIGPFVARGLTGLGRSLGGVLGLVRGGPLLVVCALALCFVLVRFAVRAWTQRR